MEEVEGEEEEEEEGNENDNEMVLINDVGRDGPFSDATPGENRALKARRRKWEVHLRKSLARTPIGRIKTRLQR